ncbi:hypothetical protein, partial [Spongiibacter tropicus]|uniref:hypothetical protein n=1 Tax=Spongiibacter tropicus TaxID=454602 RepID=UPI0023566C5B
AKFTMPLHPAANSQENNTASLRELRPFSEARGHRPTKRIVHGIAKKATNFNLQSNIRIPSKRRE